MLLEYDGGAFCGWQRQGVLPTVQAVLEEAAGRLAGAAVRATAAGRTDAGVHAAGQVVMLDLPRPAEARAVRDGLNYYLKPHAVAVLAAAPAAAGWNPRFSAIHRRYRYAILNRAARPALEAGRVWHVRRALDVAAMQAGAGMLLGQHDFTSFRAVACQAASPVRTLDRLEVTRAGERLEVWAEARSFLHHQVRNMVGSLVLVGEGRWPAGRMRAALEARDRVAAGPTAPAAGLTLVEVVYATDPFG